MTSTRSPFHAFCVGGQKCAASTRSSPFAQPRSLESQEVYTQANTREVLAALKAAAIKLRTTHAWTPSASGLLLPCVEHNY